MKRDMDTIRKIVLAVRDADGPVTKVDGVTDEEFVFHVQLLEEAGLVHAAIQCGGKRPATHALIWRLTWQGHDFADSIADDSVWRKAKQNVLKPAASWSFGVLIKYLELEIRSRIPGLDRLL